MVFLGACFGLAMGGTMTIQNGAYAEHFGRKHNGSIQSVAKMLMVVTSALLPTALSLLHQKLRHNYVWGTALFGLYPLAVGSLATVALWRERRAAARASDEG